MTSELGEDDSSGATSIQGFCARATLYATIRCLCRTKELQLTDCQSQHCRAKREPRTDYNVAFVRPGGAGGGAFDKIVRSAQIGAVRGGSIPG